MSTQSPVVKSAKRATAWYIVAAVLFIVVGLFAIAEPAVAGLGVAILVGWLLLFGGVAHFVACFDGGGGARVAYHVLAAIVFVIGGVYLLMHPLLGLGSLTLLLAGVILAVGIVEIVAWFQHRSRPGAGWMLFNGIIALLLGGLIWFHWPSSSVWAIGTLVGVNLLFTGWTRLMLGIAGRRLIRQVS